MEQSTADASLELVRHQLDNLVTLRWTGSWTPEDEADYHRLAQREAVLLGHRPA
jgi:hypothetical protein